MNDRTTTIGKASAEHLNTIRSIIRTLAQEAGLREPEAVRAFLAHPDEGLDRAAAEGDRDAAGAPRHWDAS